MASQVPDQRSVRRLPNWQCNSQGEWEGGGSYSGRQRPTDRKCNPLLGGEGGGGGVLGAAVTAQTHQKAGMEVR